MPLIVKYIICIIKKIFCIVTIREDNVCILPYKKIRSTLIIDLIVKIIKKTTKNVVLSNYLNEVEDLKYKLIKEHIQIYNGKVLMNYLLCDAIQYVLKIRREECYTQEIFILTNHPNSIDKENIVYFAKQFKRINIVTSNMQFFQNIEEYLEEKLGMAITVSNNKRKSLSKAKIIVNLDFDEELINKFHIYQNAIIFNPNTKVEIQSKLFNGIHIYDYQISYQDIFKKHIFDSFNKKQLYESIIANKTFIQAIQQISEDNVKIVNLIGKNGIIHKREIINDMTIPYLQNT